jgi:hypothetical protein
VKRPGGDRGSHGVAGVMEAVGEVKGQSRQDYQHQDEVISHENSVSTREVAVDTSKRRVNRLSLESH